MTFTWHGVLFTETAVYIGCTISRAIPMTTTVAADAATAYAVTTEAASAATTADYIIVFQER